MGQWVLPGPDAQVMTRSEVAFLLRLSDATLDRMIRAGRFPRGHKLSPQSDPLWTGADLAAYFHLASRMIPEDEKPAASEKS